MKPELVEAHIKLLNERVNLKSEIEALENGSSSPDIPVKTINTYYTFHQDKIEQLKKRLEELKKLSPQRLKPLQPSQPAQISDEFLPKQNPQYPYYKKLLVVRDKDGHQKPIEALYNDKDSVKDAAEGTIYSAHQIIQNYAGVWPPQLQWEPFPNQTPNIKSIPPQPPQPPPQPPQPPPQPPQTQQDKLLLHNEKLLTLYNKTKVLEKQVDELRKKYPNVMVPILKDAKDFEDVIRNLEEQKAILETAAALATPPPQRQRTHNLKIIKADNFSQENQQSSLKLILSACGLQEGDQIKNLRGNKNINITLPKGEYKKQEEVVIYYSESQEQIKERIDDDQTYDEKIVRNGVTMECKDGSLKVVGKQDMPSPAQISDEFLPEQNPQELKPWICDELYELRDKIQIMSSLRNLTITDIPNINDYKHKFVKTKITELQERIKQILTSNAKTKTLPNTDIEKFVKEIQAEINRIKCPERGGGKTLRRRQMKTTRTRTLVPR
jgi:hypothetical protein